MRSITLVLILALSQLVWAKPHHHHREHSAHTHGAGTLGIVFEGAKGQVELKIPSESIIGFEYKAVSEKDKKSQEKALEKLNQNISEMIAFDADLKCVYTKDKIEIKFHSKNHSEVVAHFKVNCAHSPAGASVSIGFYKHFPKIKNIQAQVVFDNVQKSFQIKNEAKVFNLK